MFMNFESSFTFFFPIGVIFLFLFLIFISNFLKMVEFKSLMKEIIFHFFMIIYPSMWLMIILFFLIMMMNVFSLVPSVFSLSSLPLMTLSMSFLMWLSGYLYSIITKYNNCVSNFFLLITIVLILSLFFWMWNLLIFFMLFEFVLLPMVLIIVLWSSQSECLLANYYFLLYTILGSFPLMLITLSVSMKGQSNYLVQLLNIEPKS